MNTWVTKIEKTLHEWQPIDLKYSKFWLLGLLGNSQNLTFLANGNHWILFKIWMRRRTGGCQISLWKPISQSGRENSILYPEFLHNHSQNLILWGVKHDCRKVK